MAHRNLWLIDMGDGTWAVCCLACRVALYRGPSPSPTECPPATAANPSSPSADPADGADQPSPRPIPLVKEKIVHRSNHRTRHATTLPSWGPAPGWDQPLPGWTPLLDPGPLPLRAAAGSVARWWWPTLAVAGFLAVAIHVTDHDPSLSQRGLLTIALAALVIVLLTIHRTAGPSRLARAAAEYTAVALLATLLTLTAAGTQQPTTPTARARPSRRPAPRPARTAHGPSGSPPA